MERKLTIKQEKFCHEYITTGNASEAYRRAYNAEGMKPETVNRKAKVEIDKDKIRARLEALQESAQERTMVRNSKMAEGKKSGPKGPRFVLTDEMFDQICAMCERFATAQDICHIYGISQDTLARRLNERGINFAELVRQREATTRTALKGVMIRKALEGDNGMLVWISKNLMGWSDRHDVRAKNEVNVTAETAVTDDMTPEEAMRIVQDKIAAGKEPA